MTSGDWALLAAAVPLGVYGLLNLIAPQVTIRWQRRWTRRAHARSDAVGEAVGGAFGSWVGVGCADPAGRARARRRVRWIGAVEVAVAATLAAPAWLA